MRRTLVLMVAVPLASGTPSIHRKYGAEMFGMDGSASASNMISGMDAQCGILAQQYSAIFGDDAINMGSYFAGMKLGSCVGAGFYAETWSALTPRNTTVAMKISTAPPTNSTASPTNPFKDECTFARMATAHVEQADPEAIADCLASGAVTVVTANNATVSLPYLVSEFINGTELENVLKQSPEIPEAPLTSLEGVFAVLEKVHEIMVLLADPVIANPPDHVSLYHNDISPSNIMLLPDGNLNLLDYGLSFLCCDETVPLTESDDASGMKCDLKEDIGYVFDAAAPQNERSAVRPCKGRWADTLSYGEIGKQKSMLAQTFIGMLIKYPVDVQGGLTSWWHIRQRNQTEEHEHVTPIKRLLRPVYSDQWTEQCDDALKQALLPEEVCDLQCFFRALEIARGSLSGASSAEVEHALESEVKFWVTPWWM